MNLAAVHGFVHLARGRFAAAVCVILLFGASIGCRNLEIQERWREPGWAFSRRLQNVAVLEPVVAPYVGESPLMYAVLPFSYVTQLLTLRWPERAEAPFELIDSLRITLASHLESLGLHSIEISDVNDAVANQRHLMEVGADYALHTRIIKWERGYLILGSWIRIVIDCQLVRLNDGAVVWDGTVESTRQAGIIQLGSMAWSLAASAPVAGVPVGQISALTGPLARLRGGVYREIIRDLARLLALHISPSVLEPCRCNLCEDATEKREEEAEERAEQMLEEGAIAHINNPVRGDSPVVQAVVSGGNGRPFHPGDIIEVFAVAPAHAVVSFDLGKLYFNIPMLLQGRVTRDGRTDLGLFRGSYVIEERDVRGEPIAIEVHAIARDLESAPRAIDGGAIQILAK
ncbi:MAG: hypothetical protein ACKVS6_00185 [Planctomycetota bacterium]